MHQSCFQRVAVLNLFLNQKLVFHFKLLSSFKEFFQKLKNALEIKSKTSYFVFHHERNICLTSDIQNLGTRFFFFFLRNFDYCRQRSMFKNSNVQHTSLKILIKMIHFFFLNKKNENSKIQYFLEIFIQNSKFL